MSRGQSCFTEVREEYMGRGVLLGSVSLLSHFDHRFQNISFILF